jgi:predicted alternative tryptophan synthase beta-subunit
VNGDQAERLTCVECGHEQAAGDAPGRAYLQNDVFGSAMEFARHEGIIPAPEAAHAIHGALETAWAADEAEIERALAALEGLPTPA